MMKYRYTLTSPFVFALLAITASCSDERPVAPREVPAPPEHLVVSITPKAETLYVGTAKTFVAHVTNQFGVARLVPVAWISTRPELASVSAAGVVTGFTPGVVRIIASAGTAADTAELVVRPVIAAFAILPNAVQVAMGDSVRFSASFGSGGDANPLPVRWTSSDTALATVTVNGTLIPRSEGSVILTAEAQGVAARASALIFGRPVASLTVSPAVVSRSPGSKVPLSAVARDELGRAVSRVAVTWSTSDPQVASVDSAGVVTCITRGYAIITAVAGGRQGTATINVGPKPAGRVEVSLGNTSIVEGGTTSATALVFDRDGLAITDLPVSWQSANPAVATVTSSGLVTGQIEGTTTISAISGGEVGSLAVRVSKRLAAGVSISPANPVVQVGKSAKLTAEVLDQNGTPIAGAQPVLTSSAQLVATVANNGMLTGLAAGTTTITATYNGLTASVTATVSQIPVASVTVSPTAVTLGEGQTSQLVGKTLASDGTVLAGRPIAWSSSNATVASVSGAGVVQANAAGTATITAASEGRSATATVTVNARPPAAVASVSVTLNSGTLVVGQSTQASVILRDSSGAVLSGRSVTWLTSNTNLATVSSSGLVQAVGAGTVSISATVDQVTGATGLTVEGTPPAEVASVTFSLASSEVVPGQSITTTTVLRDANGTILTGRTIAYFSQNAAVAAAAADGRVTGLSVGEAGIVASSGSAQDTSMLRVVAESETPVASVGVTLNSPALAVGQSTQAVVTVSDAAGNVLTGRSVVYSSSNTAVATVGSTGVVSAISAGSATITATSEGKSGSASLNVSGTTSPVSLVSLVLSPVTVTSGATSLASVTLKDAQGNTLTGRVVTFSSSNTTVATVNSSGLISAITAGTALIVASCEGKSASAALTVNPPPAVATVTVTVTPSSFGVGELGTASVVLRDAQGGTLTGRPVTFSSSAPSVASVSASGQVTGVAAGSANIIATSEGRTGTTTVTVVSSGGQFAVLPTLPQATVDVSPVPVTGSSLRVTASSSLQNALNSAKPGDEIVIDPGTVFTGNFVLPAKTGTGWILIRSGGQLPVAGQRMTPSVASSLPRIQTNNTFPALKTAESASGYRIVGVEFTVAPGNTSVSEIVSLGDGDLAQNQLSKVPSRLILDRVWVHGTSTLNLRRCVGLNSANTAVINSTIAQCNNTGFDAQAVWGWNGPGPFLIENNYLEASTENVGFGGGTPGIQGLIPSDVTIRGNHIAKPATMKNSGYLVKNLVEFKVGQRILIEGNLIEGNWQAAQPGYALVITPADVGGTCRWCTVRDVTFRLNRVRRTGSVLNLAGNVSGIVPPAVRIRFEQNLFDEVNTGVYSGQGRLFLLQNAGLSDISFVHNTALGTDIALLLVDAPMTRLDVRDNIVSSTSGYGIWSGNGQPQGVKVLDYHVPSTWRVAGNVLVSFNASVHPSGNNYPSSLSGVGFRNISAFDWGLSSTSPFRGKAGDGTDPGVDVTQLNATLAQVVVP